MTKTSSSTELRNMSAADLTTEINQLMQAVAHMKLSLEMLTEKDSGKYQRARRSLARMKTILSEKSRGEALPSVAKNRTVSPSSKASTSAPRAKSPAKKRSSTTTKKS